MATDTSILKAVDVLVKIAPSDHYENERNVNGQCSSLFWKKNIFQIIIGFFSSMNIETSEDQQRKHQLIQKSLVDNKVFVLQENKNKPREARVVYPAIQSSLYPDATIDGEAIDEQLSEKKYGHKVIRYFLDGLQISLPMNNSVKAPTFCVYDANCYEEIIDHDPAEMERYSIRDFILT